LLALLGLKCKNNIRVAKVSRNKQHEMKVWAEVDTTNTLSMKPVIESSSKIAGGKK
jgi:hypothetical protein